AQRPSVPRRYEDRCRRRQHALIGRRTLRHRFEGRGCAMRGPRPFFRPGPPVIADRLAHSGVDRPGHFVGRHDRVEAAGGVRRLVGPGLALTATALTLVVLECATRVALTPAAIVSLPHVGLDLAEENHLRWIEHLHASDWRADEPDPLLGWRRRPGVRY